MEIALSEHFTYKKLLKFTIPSVLMMVFTSIYGVVDGFFISNFVGAQEFAAINFMYPFLMVVGAVGFMFSAGGSALVAKTLGERKKQKANTIFSLVVYATFIIGLILSLIALLFIRQITQAFGVEGAFLDKCLLYVYILFPFIPIFMLQSVFQAFLIVAERPKLGLYVTVAAGVGNMALDALFIIGFGWGLAGAAWATALSQVIGAGLPLIYFCSKKSLLLRLGKTHLYTTALAKIAINGSSEFMSNISMSIVTVLYNYQLLKFAGEAGVAAFGVISYANFIFISAFLGYTIGNNPIVSYNYGAMNHKELRNVFKKNLVMIGVTGIALFVISEIFALPIVKIFVGYDAELTNITTHGFRIYAISFLLCGFNIYASAFFTALNNGLISAIISFVRTIIFECGCVMILPMFFALDGIWSAIIVAEIMALVTSAYFIYSYRRHYHYI